VHKVFDEFYDRGSCGGLNVGCEGDSSDHGDDDIGGATWEDDSDGGFEGLKLWGWSWV
jgi:hypothetical protein